MRQYQYQDNVTDILAKADDYHTAYYEAETFEGPSLYFHRRSLETRDSITDTHLEYIYATLTSWGMHRMGKGGAKMRSFEKFQQSIVPLRGKIVEAKKFDFAEMSERKWNLLKELFQGISIMVTGTMLVGNSKVMHHMMPNIVPPIDREYTLQYLHGNKNIKNDPNHEWEMMKAIISHFFIPVASDQEFRQKAQEWIHNQDRYQWDTSIFKVIDNLVIGSQKQGTKTSG